jgi:hypothetical protein
VSILTAFRRLGSACAVFFGPHGSVTDQARQQGRSRQALYREADHALASLEGSQMEARLAALRQQLADCQDRLLQLQQRLQQAVEVTPDRQAEFAATAQAQGVSLAQAHALLAVLLGPATPSRAALGRLARDAGRQAGPILEVLDESSRGRARQIAADEIFSGRRPILMTLEQDSLCWLGGRLADNRDGDTWARELGPLTAAEQVTADAALGIRAGLRQVNARRRQAGLPEVLSQRDHFHALHRARRAVRTARHQAAEALGPAERAQKAYDRDGRAGLPRTPAQGRALNQAWARAERAFDRWSAQERAFERLRRGLRLFTPEGELNTRERAEAEVRQALAGQAGPDWSRARQLLGPEAFTFLDRVHEQLAALPLDPELRAAAVQVEGLRRQPQALRGESPQARALRGVLLASELVLALAKGAGQQALRSVRGVLDGAWRASSLVEGLNSVLRMQQRRQKRLTQGLLDLKRLYWNVRVFRAGKRKGSSPYQRLGLVLPQGSWWQLLHRDPQQLRQELSRQDPTASAEQRGQELSAQKLAA